MAATHCFDKTVTETVVEDNINPIAKVERSSDSLGLTHKAFQSYRSVMKGKD